MSFITAALAFLHARKWLVELLLIAAVIGGIAWWHHSTLENGIREGVAQQQMADTIASQMLQDQVDALTKQNVALALAAKAKYDSDHAANVAAAAAPVGVSQLCNHDSHSGQVHLPATGTAKPGDAATVPAQGLVQSVPSGDSGQSDYRRRLLGAIASVADDQTAVIREYQAR